MGLRGAPLVQCGEVAERGVFVGRVGWPNSCSSLLNGFGKKGNLGDRLASPRIVLDEYVFWLKEKGPCAWSVLTKYPDETKEAAQARLKRFLQKRKGRRIQ